MSATDPRTEAARFRKKPVVVEAMQWDGTAKGASPIIDWMLAAEPEGCARYHDNQHIPSLSVIRIDTLEGTMSTDPYDWIIRGIQGEFYPCKNDIFDASYERADAADTRVQQLTELEHERDLLRDVALRIWNEVEPSEKHRELMVSLGFTLSMTGDRGLSAAVLAEVDASPKEDA